MRHCIRTLACRSPLAARCSSSPRRRRCIAQTYPTGNDPRNGLKPGTLDAGDGGAAACGSCRSRRSRPNSTRSRGLTFINSDLAFRDHYVYQGNFAGFIDLGREESGEAGDGRGRSVHHVAGRSVDRRQPALHLGRRQRQPQRLREGRREGPDSDHMAGVRIYDVVEPEQRRSCSRTCRRAKDRTRTRSSPTRRTRASSTSTSRAAAARGRTTELAGCKNGDRSGRHDELAVPPRRDQGAARASRAGRRS